jgi:hypothetical protein
MLASKIRVPALTSFSFTNNIDKLFNKIIVVCLFIAFLFILLMSQLSGYNEHPDEHLHFTATQYYYSHWLPPKIGDPDTLNSYSKYGASYLNSLEIVYFISGKFSILSHLFLKQYRAERLFNNFLFFILLCYCLSINVGRINFVILLITPQVWYVFGYLNGDAFPFFLSFLIINELVIEDSLFNKFICSNSTFHIRLATIFLGFLISLLLQSKANYYIMIMYIFFLLSWKISDYSSTDRKKFFKIYLYIVIIGLSVFLARYLCDLAINGFLKEDKVLLYADKLAESQFKPSLNPKNMFFTLRLRDKGVKYSELFTSHKWHEISYKSFIGTYGWMNIFSPSFYYILMIIFYILFITFIIFSIFCTSSLKNILFLLTTLLFMASTIIISTINSWVYDFQAQGRYLFPALVMLCPVLYMNDKILNKKILAFIVLVIFILSCYSFIFVGLLKVPRELKIIICSLFNFLCG